MVTLHIAAWLAQEGFGTLDQDICWEEEPVDMDGKPRDGIWIVSRGTPYGRYIKTQAFDIYTRYSNKLTGSAMLEAILERLQNAYGDTCELPTMEPHSTATYTEVRLMPTSGIENVGSDAQDKMVRVISGEVKYKKLS